MSSCVNNRTFCIQDVTLSSSKRSLLISSFWTLYFLSARALPLSVCGMIQVQSAVLLLCSDSFIKTRAAAPTAAVARGIWTSQPLLHSPHKSFMHLWVSVCSYQAFHAWASPVSEFLITYELYPVYDLAFMLLRVPLQLTYTYLHALKPECSKCKYCK